MQTFQLIFLLSYLGYRCTFFGKKKGTFLADMNQDCEGANWRVWLAGSSKPFLGIWCDFDRASSLICGKKLPTRCNRRFYCRSYCLLNMFRVPLCPSSGAQEYYTVVASCKPDTQPSAPHQTSNFKTTARNTTGSNHRIILLSSWWWA